MEKINKTTSWFLEKLIKIDKYLARLAKRKRENEIPASFISFPRTSL